MANYIQDNPAVILQNKEQWHLYLNYKVNLNLVEWSVSFRHTFLDLWRHLGHCSDHSQRLDTIYKKQNSRKLAM